MDDGGEKEVIISCFIIDKVQRRIWRRSVPLEAKPSSEGKV